MRSLATEYAAAGADAIMVMPVDHSFIHEQGLVAYYSQLADSCDLPLVPYIRGIEPQAETIAQIADLERVAGIKYAIRDTEVFARAVAASDGEATWVCGMGEPPVPAYWVEGAEGFTSGVGNIRPEIGLALFEALEDENWERALRIRRVTLQFQRLRGETGQDNIVPAANSVPVLKAGLELAGQYGGPVRDPLVSLSSHDRDRVRDAYEDIEQFVATDLDPMQSLD
jgi:4-hydroxy-tetrahydrodipicolinate synthase